MRGIKLTPIITAIIPTPTGINTVKPLLIASTTGCTSASVIANVVSMFFSFLDKYF